MTDGYQEYLEAVQSGKYTFTVGADECGFGSWAGPLYVCAVAVPINWKPIAGLNDSKKLRPAKREELYYFLRDRISHVCTQAEASEIDRDGVGTALRRCFTESVNTLLTKFPNALVVLDGEVQLPNIDHLHFPKADGLVPAVMAASVIGKVTHDRQMIALAAKYPGYGFGKHAGYGTKDHLAAIKAKGLTPEHRRSYNFEGSGKGAPIAEETGMTVDDETYKGGLQHEGPGPDKGLDV
jgi:ribonuclease HII